MSIEKTMMIRKLIHSLLLTTGAFTTLMFMHVSQSYAQDNEVTPTPDSASVITTTSTISASTSGPITITEVSLAQLGYDEEPIQGPYGSLRSAFGLPADWVLTEGAELQLLLNAYVSGAIMESTTNLTETLLGELNVSLNDIPLTSFSLNGQQQAIIIPISTTAFIPTRDDGRHKLEISFGSLLDCDVDARSEVVVSPNSSFVIPHQMTTPPTDLTRLPRPIYQDTFTQDSAYIVIPNQPSASELQAALSVAAGFGEMTNGKLDLTLKPLGQLTPEMRKSHHLIFVGKPQTFDLLKDVALPAAVSESGFRIREADTDDGVIQMAVSPWNESKVVLIVSGNSDMAVEKSGQAVSSGIVRPGTQPNLALVAQVQSDEPLGNPLIIDQTFDYLDYEAETFEGRGVSSTKFYFNIPPGYVPEDNIYLDLVFNHSSLLDYEDSTLTVKLNNKVIGSLQLTEKSANLTTTRFPIPVTMLRQGNNELEISANLKPYTICIDPTLGELWLSIWPDSLIHLPLRKVEGLLRQNFSFRDYPLPFSQNPTLGNTTFILSAQDPTAWEVAAQIAFDLGNRTGVSLAELTVITDDTISEEVRQTDHLLIVGHPSQLPIITELDYALPAPFEAGSDIATERAMRVVYRTPNNKDVGYLELLPAPWQPNLSILAVLGGNDNGLRMAGALLTEPELRNNLRGKFLIIDSEQIVAGDRVVDLKELNTADVVTAVETESVLPPEPLAPAVDADVKIIVEATPGDDGSITQISNSGIQQSDWILPLLGISTGLMIITLIIVLGSAWIRRNRSTTD